MSLTRGLQSMWDTLEKHDDFLERITSLTDDDVPSSRDCGIDQLNQSFLSIDLNEDTTRHTSTHEDYSQDDLMNNSVTSLEEDPHSGHFNMEDLVSSHTTMFSMSDITNTDCGEDFLPEADLSSSDENLLTSESFGFKVYKPPALLVRHPPPAEGRDDDPRVLKEILKDILLKTGHNTIGEEQDFQERILFAPDNKIGKNLFKIMKTDRAFNKFLPEFPLLHLRKSKILNFCSAYGECGLHHLFGFMQDREVDLKKLIGLENIEEGTKNIRRLSLALHLAFMIKFLESLPKEIRHIILESLRSSKVDTESYHPIYLKFMQEQSAKNANFALHRDMLLHCQEILAIRIAERIGGPDGYDLLLAAVKSSLPFSFLNGATSYAVFCCQLLHTHYSTGYFHRLMKKNLFSTPYKGSRINFGLDTQRETPEKMSCRNDFVTSVLIPEVVNMC